MSVRFPEHKIFNIKIPIDLWFSIKTEAMKQDMPMTGLIEKILRKYDKNIKKKLTQDEC